MFAGKAFIARDAQIAPGMRVAEFIRPLQMNKGNIRIDGRHRVQGVAAKRTGHEFQAAVGPKQIASQGGFGGHERYPHRTCAQGHGQG